MAVTKVPFFEMFSHFDDEFCSKNRDFFNMSYYYSIKYHKFASFFKKESRFCLSRPHNLTYEHIINRDLREGLFGSFKL